MAQIDTYINEILTAVYGEEVRGSIVNALRAQNSETESTTATAEGAVEKLAEYIATMNGDWAAALENIKTAIADAETATGNADTATGRATDAAEAAEAAASDAETAAKEANAAAEGANAAAQTANEAAENANSAADRVDESIKAATEAADNANTAATAANEAADSANTAAEKADGAGTDADEAADRATEAAERAEKAISDAIIGINVNGEAAEVIDHIVSLFFPSEEEIQTMIAEQIAEIVAGAPESLDTLKEIADWIEHHEDDAAAMNSAIQTNAENIVTAQSAADAAQETADGVLEYVRDYIIGGGS